MPRSWGVSGLATQCGINRECLRNLSTQIPSAAWPGRWRAGTKVAWRRARGRGVGSWVGADVLSPGFAYSDFIFLSSPLPGPKHPHSHFSLNPHPRVLFSILERPEGREREREISRELGERSTNWLSPLHTPTGDQTRNRGVCPDLDSNPFRIRTTLQPTQPSAGPPSHFLLTSQDFQFALLIFSQGSRRGGCHPPPTHSSSTGAKAQPCWEGRFCLCFRSDDGRILTRTATERMVMKPTSPPAASVRHHQLEDRITPSPNPVPLGNVLRQIRSIPPSVRILKHPSRNSVRHTLEDQ